MAVCYPYKCQKDPQHYFERDYEWNKYPPEHECIYEGCDGIAKRIITNFFMSVDNVDKVDMSFTLGRNFSNKSELEAYYKAKGLRHLEDDEWAADREALARQNELVAEFRGRGQNYYEHLANEKARKKAAAQERLKSLGISVAPVDSTEAQKMMGDGEMAEMIDPHEQDRIDYSKPLYNEHHEHMGYKAKEIDRAESLQIKEKYRDVVEKKNFGKYAAMR